MCKICAFSPKELPKGRNFTYVEDPGIYIYDNIYILYSIYTLNPFQDLPRNNRFFFLRVFLEIKARRPDVDERMEASLVEQTAVSGHLKLGPLPDADRTVCFVALGVYDFPLNHQMTFFGLKHCEC